MLATALLAMSQTSPHPLYLSCAPTNDLYLALRAGGVPVLRSETPAEAILSTAAGSSVLLLADEYPDKRVELDEFLIEQARSKAVKIYIEFPAGLPGLEFGETRAAGVERLVVLGPLKRGQTGGYRIVGARLNLHVVRWVGVNQVDLGSV